MNHRFLFDKTSNTEKMLKQGLRGAIIELYDSQALSRIQHTDSLLLKESYTYEKADELYGQK